jgi:hypothetical protein
MNRSKSDFCNEQAQRMLTLAKESTDTDLRHHLITMARNWSLRAKANKSANAIQQARSIWKNVGQGSRSNDL